MNRRYGYSAYAAMGALFGAALPFGFQLGLGPVSIVVCAIVGALFGAALRDAL